MTKRQTSILHVAIEHLATYDFSRFPVILDGQPLTRREIQDLYWELEQTDGLVTVDRMTGHDSCILK